MNGNIWKVFAEYKTGETECLGAFSPSDENPDFVPAEAALELYKQNINALGIKQLSLVEVHPVELRVPVYNMLGFQVSLVEVEM